MHGVIQSNLELDFAPQFFRYALEVLEWGASNLWKHVPRGDRGANFDETFTRRVKQLYLNTLVQAYRPNQSAKQAQLRGHNKTGTRDPR